MIFKKNLGSPLEKKCAARLSPAWKGQFYGGGAAYF
jgi:hypothetical protein